MAGGMRRQKSEQAKSEHAECPVCGAALQGSRFSGYSCVKCGSHFSGRFMMHLRKREFKSHIAAHFGVGTPEPSPTGPSPVSPASQETQEFIIKDDGRIQETIDRLHETVHGVVGEVDRGVQELDTIPLEELLGGATEAVPDAPAGPSGLAAPPMKLRSSERVKPASAKSAARKSVVKRVVMRKSAVKKPVAKKPAGKKSAREARTKRHASSMKLRRRAIPSSGGKRTAVKRKRPR